MNETTLGAISLAIGGAIGAAVTAYLKIAGDRHARDKETHGTTVEEYRELLDRTQKENDRLNDEMTAMRGRKELLIAKLTGCYQNSARAEERIASLEELLAANNIPFRKWTPRDGGDTANEIEARP